MTSFTGDVFIDGVPLCIGSNDSRQLQRCLIVANAISSAWLIEFVDSISSDYEYSDPILIIMRPGALQYAPAISFIANKALGHKVEVVEYFKNTR